MSHAKHPHLPLYLRPLGAAADVLAPWVRRGREGLYDLLDRAQEQVGFHHPTAFAIAEAVEVDGEHRLMLTPVPWPRRAARLHVARMNRRRAADGREPVSLFEYRSHGAPFQVTDDWRWPGTK